MLCYAMLQMFMRLRTICFQKGKEGKKSHLCCCQIRIAMAFLSGNPQIPLLPLLCCLSSSSSSSQLSPSNLKLSRQSPRIVELIHNNLTQLTEKLVSAPTSNLVFGSQTYLDRCRGSKILVVEDLLQLFDCGALVT